MNSENDGKIVLNGIRISLRFGVLTSRGRVQKYAYLVPHVSILGNLIGQSMWHSQAIIVSMTETLRQALEKLHVEFDMSKL